MRTTHTDFYPWNEVNMYSDDGVGDGGLQAALMRNLVGLVDMQARCVLPHTGPPPHATLAHKAPGD